MAVSPDDELREAVEARTDEHPLIRLQLLAAARYPDGPPENLLLIWRRNRAVVRGHVLGARLSLSEIDALVA